METLGVYRPPQANERNLKHNLVSQIHPINIRRAPAEAGHGAEEQQPGVRYRCQHGAEIQHRRHVNGSGQE